MHADHRSEYHNDPHRFVSDHRTTGPRQSDMDEPEIAVDEKIPRSIIYELIKPRSSMATTDRTVLSNRATTTTLQKKKAINYIPS